jgi:predicted cupin superfamily sugar epimerase
MTAIELINNLKLQPHPEGGYYKETYRSKETTTNKNGNQRNVCTAIYFLLENNEKSHFHRIQSDELWFFHLGQSLEIIYILENEIKTISLGNNMHDGDVLFCKIPANTWFGCKVKLNQGFSLVSCTVAPGFDFNDFELAKRENMIQDFPNLKLIIDEFTRE